VKQRKRQRPEEILEFKLIRFKWSVMKLFGILKDWNPVRGFGFIRVINKERIVTRFFLHICDIKSGAPAIGAGVEFVLDEATPKPGDAPKAREAEIGEVLPKFRPAPPAADVLAGTPAEQPTDASEKGGFVPEAK
jgi:hypothetical protein